MRQRKKVNIGDKYGRLTVIREAKELAAKGKYSMYECKCTCGNTKIIYGTNLTNGSTKSCGCLRKDILHKQAKAVAPGDRFGYLTVIKELEKTKDHRLRYECKCDCGNTVVRFKNSLVSGTTRSCGCIRKNHQFKVNDKFNYWTILEIISRNKFKCKCTCGTIKVLTYGDLFKKNIKDCGCRNKKRRSVKINTGDRFGKLVVLREIKRDGKLFYECLCDCGEHVTVYKSNLVTGNTRSCGCLRKDTYNY